MLERGGGFVLMFFALVLLGVNLGLATAVWAVFRKEGGLGVVGGLLTAAVLFALTSLAFLLLTAVPDGYPTPPGSCPDGRPSGWSVLIPG
jgi:hypothetical protein